jgi:dipeptidyl aminopeptidase/acylaminoacyl peptidase
MNRFIVSAVLIFLCLLLAETLAPPGAVNEEDSVQPNQGALIPRRLLFGNPEKTSAKISPDGTKLAYIAPDAKNILNVWVRDLKSKGQAHQVTADHKRGIRQFIWQFDNDHILYPQDKDGDENWHLYQTHIGTRETRDLTPFDGVKAEILSVDPLFPQKMLIKMNKRDPSLSDVYRLDLKTGLLALDTENPGDVIRWVADHRLQIRAALAYAKDGSLLIRVRDNGTASWRNLLTIDQDEIAPDDILGVITFADDNQSLYLITSLGGNTARLLKIDLSTGQKTVIAEDPHYDVTELLLDPKTYALEAVGIDRERYDWIVLDPQLKADFNEIFQQLKGPFNITSRDDLNQNWIVISQSDQHPNQFYLYRRQSKALEFLFSAQPDLERYPLSPMEAISFEARDGLALHGYLTLPQDLPPENLPAVILVHGGPWFRDSWGFNPLVQWLANRGYVVLQINFRGSTGYGKSHLNAGNREWGNAMHQDILDGRKWLVEKGYADPQRIAIFGESYGGYETLAALAFSPQAFCCGIDVVGPSSLITLLKTLPPDWAALRASFDARVGKLESDQELLKSRSPLFKADQIKKPLLITQGANDPRVKQAESDQIVAAMRRKHLPIEYLLFKDEGHGLVRPENKLKFYAAAEDFFAKYLGGRQEPPTLEENWESLKR